LDQSVEITGEWSNLHNEELHMLCSSPNSIRQMEQKRMRWAGHVARMEEENKVHRVWVGKSEGKSPLGRPRRRWEDGIRGRLAGSVEWIHLVQNRGRWQFLVDTVMKLRVLAPPI
jgi:hypothetical protein